MSLIYCLCAPQELPTEEHANQDDMMTPDAAELDEENARKLQEKGISVVCALLHNKKCFCYQFFTERQDFLLRSQAVQRSLPRPNDVNTTILRGAVHSDQKMKSLYEVCVSKNITSPLKSGGGGRT